MAKMKRIFLFVLLLIFVFCPRKAEAAAVAGHSASPRVFAGQEEDLFDERYLSLLAFLRERKSPLVKETRTFLRVADKYHLDWRLLPAIAGLESAFGKKLVPNSFNPFGWGGGYYYFSGWAEAIETVGRSLSKNYYRRGLDTPEKIGPVYAPPNPRWGILVRALMERISP